MTEDFHYFRDHDTPFGWGVRHAPTNRIYALIANKSEAIEMANRLNAREGADYDSMKWYMQHEARSNLNAKIVLGNGRFS